MTMDFIQIDQDKCTRCGVCATVCPGVIGMGDNGPQAITGSLCELRASVWLSALKGHWIIRMPH